MKLTDRDHYALQPLRRQRLRPLIRVDRNIKAVKLTYRRFAELAERSLSQEDAPGG